MQQTPSFQLIQNTLQTENLPVLKDLISLKCLYSKQLSKMPREYLIKLLFDTYHQSLIIKIQNEIIAGLTFRSFDNQQFYEIAFVAVKQQHKLKGFGSLLINKFKNLTQQHNIKHVFTFGDDGAIGFFQKHGFSKNITLPKQIYQTYVKQYIGGKLMECKLDFQTMIDFQNLNQSLQESRNQVIQKVKSLISLAPYNIQKSSKIISRFSQKELFSNQLIEYIPGLKEVSNGKNEKSEDKNNIALNFLLYCQNFIEIASTKAVLLKDNIEEYAISKNISQKQHTRRKQLLYLYRSLLHQLQIQLLQGNFKFKDQFINFFNQIINRILGPQEKLKPKEKQFHNKIKQLTYDFMKNQISFQSIQKKFKLQNHPKI